MEATLLQTIGNLIALLVFIGLPLLLVIKNPQTTLSLVKTGFTLLVRAGKFIAPFIVPLLIVARFGILNTIITFNIIKKLFNGR